MEDRDEIRGKHKGRCRWETNRWDSVEMSPPTTELTRRWRRQRAELTSFPFRLRISWQSDACFQMKRLTCAPLLSLLSAPLCREDRECRGGVGSASRSGGRPRAACRRAAKLTYRNAELTSKHAYLLLTRGTQAVSWSPLSSSIFPTSAYDAHTASW